MGPWVILWQLPEKSGRVKYVYYYLFASPCFYYCHHNLESLQFSNPDEMCSDRAVWPWWQKGVKLITFMFINQVNYDYCLYRTHWATLSGGSNVNSMNCHYPLWIELSSSFSERIFIESTTWTELWTSGDDWADRHLSLKWERGLRKLLLLCYQR